MLNVGFVGVSYSGEVFFFASELRYVGFRDP